MLDIITAMPISMRTIISDTTAMIHHDRGGQSVCCKKSSFALLVIVLTRLGSSTRVSSMEERTA